MLMVGIDLSKVCVTLHIHVWSVLKSVGKMVLRSLNVKCHRPLHFGEGGLLYKYPMN
jgi:hypothetical protein